MSRYNSNPNSKPCQSTIIILLIAIIIGGLLLKQSGVDTSHYVTYLNTNKNVIIGSLVVLTIVIVFMLPKMEKMNNAEEEELKENFNNLLIPKIDQHVCSRQCCKFTQWPVPFNTTNPSKTTNQSEMNTDKYIGSNLSCNLGDTGGGCVCIEKSDYEYLSTHGQ